MRRSVDPDDRPVSIGWGATLLSGVLLGLSITLIEGLTEPDDQAALATALAFMASTILFWCGTGVAVAVVAKLAEPRLPPLGLAALVVLAAFICSLFQAAIPPQPSPLLVTDGAQTGFHYRAVPPDAVFTHVLWIYLVYGGLYVVAYAASLRAMRSRQRLTRLQLNLSQEAVVLSEARLRAFQGQIQPKVLLDAVAELKARYDVGGAGADALLTRLVAFLRLAMERTRPGGATLASELRAAEAYIHLRGNLTGRPDAWRADLSVSPPTMNAASQILLPVLVDLGQRASGMSFHAAVAGERFSIVIAARGLEGAPPTAEQLIQLGAGGGHPAWSLTLDQAVDPFVCILTTRNPAAADAPGGTHIERTLV